MYIIVMLCNDNEKCYIDYVNKKFNDLKEAQNEMYKCANNELKSLSEIGNYKLVNLEEQLIIYNDDSELVTQYEIIKIDN